MVMFSLNLISALSCTDIKRSTKAPRRVNDDNGKGDGDGGGDGNDYYTTMMILQRPWSVADCSLQT